LFVLFSLGALGGCKKADDDEDAPRKKKSSSSRAANESAQASVDGKASAGLVEEYDFGTIGWSFEGDGVVKADVRDKTGAPIKEGFSGELVVAPPTKGAPATPIVLKPIDGAPLYGAALPAFSADLTPVTYVVKVKDKPFTGTVHVPAGGTTVLLSAPAPSVTVAVGTKGPHGGVIQVVGDDRMELVSDDESHEVRVYVLDADLKPVAIGERKVTLGVVADVPDTVVLVPAPDKLYLTAHWKVRADPSRVTVCVRTGPAVHVAIVGWTPGVHLLVGVRAPVWHVRVHAGWGPSIVLGEWDDDDEGHWKGKGWHGGRGHGRGHGWGKHGH
jgi:hypothetical protein